MSTWRELYRESIKLTRKVKLTRVASVVMFVLCLVVALLNAYLAITGDTQKVIWVVIHAALCVINGWNWHKCNGLLKELYDDQARVEACAKFLWWDI